MSRTTLRVVLAPVGAVDARRLLVEAARLARALDADLDAVFVEEAALLRVVALPISVEVGLVSGAARPMDAAATRRLLARSAERSRALVAQAAADLGLTWSFAVRRGDLLREALDAAAAAPVLLGPLRTPVQHVVGGRPTGRGAPTVAVLSESPSEPGESARVRSSAQPAPTASERRAPEERAWAAAVRFAGDRPDALARVSLEGLAARPAPRVLVVSLASVASPGVLERVLATARCPVVLVA